MRLDKQQFCRPKVGFAFRCSLNPKVSFRWKDYREGNAQKVMTLDAHDFIGRYLQHILPKRFVRIRSYGLLSTRNRPTKLAKCRELLNAPARAPVTEDWKESPETVDGPFY